MVWFGEREKAFGWVVIIIQIAFNVKRQKILHPLHPRKKKKERKKKRRIASSELHG